VTFNRYIFFVLTAAFLIIIALFIFETFNPGVEVYCEFHEGSEILLVNSGFEEGLVGWKSNGVVVEDDCFGGVKALLIRDYGSVRANLLKPCPAKGFKVLFAYKIVNLTADYRCILWIHMTIRVGARNFNISLGYVTGSIMRGPEFSVTRDNGWASPSNGVEYEVYNGWKIVELSLDRAFEVASRNAVARSKLGIGYIPKFRIENFNVTAIEISFGTISVKGSEGGCFLIDSITAYSPYVNQTGIIVTLSSRSIIPYIIVLSSENGVNYLNLMPFQQSKIILITQGKAEEINVYIKIPLLPIVHVRTIKPLGHE